MPHHNRHPFFTPLCEGVAPFIQTPVVHQRSLAHGIILYDVADRFLSAYLSLFLPFFHNLCHKFIIMAVLV